MLRMKLFSDTGGVCFAQIESPFELLGEYLVADVQRDPRHTQEILDAIDAVQSGKAPSWDTSGNAHVLTLEPGKGVIATEYAIPPQTLEIPIDVLREALAAWLQLIQTGKPFSNMGT